MMILKEVTNILDNLVQNTDENITVTETISVRRNRNAMPVQLTSRAVTKAAPAAGNYIHDQYENYDVVSFQLKKTGAGNYTVTVMLEDNNNEHWANMS